MNKLFENWRKYINEHEERDISISIEDDEVELSEEDKIWKMFFDQPASGVNIAEALGKEDLADALKRTSEKLNKILDLIDDPESFRKSVMRRPSNPIDLFSMAIFKITAEIKAITDSIMRRRIAEDAPLSPQLGEDWKRFHKLISMVRRSAWDYYHGRPTFVKPQMIDGQDPAELLYGMMNRTPPWEEVE